MKIIQGRELHTLAAQLTDKIQKAKSIKFYCQNFSELSVSKNSLFSFIIDELKKNSKKTKIYSYEYIQSLETPLQKDKEKGLTITKIEHKNALSNFLSTIAPTNEHENLQDALKSIEYGTLQEALDQFQEDLKKELENNESKMGKEYAPIKEDISKEIDEVFAQLKKHFENIHKNQDAQIAKTALKMNFIFFVGALFLLVTPVAIGVAATGLGMARELYFYHKEKDEIFSYSGNPVLEFLTHKAAMLITLIYPQFHNTTLVIDNEFYEFSGIDPFTIPLLKNNGGKESSIQDGFIAEQFVFHGSLPNPQDSSEKSSKKSLNIFDYFINPTNTPKPKQEDKILLLKDSLPWIEKHIKELHHFAYIEAPYFNAIKLANLFKSNNIPKAQPSKETSKNSGSKEMSINNSSKTRKGILIISENPTKNNAGLSQYITQDILSNKIKRGESPNRPTIKPGEETYNSQRDFSDYKIAIRKDDPSAPFVLQLAPFAFQSQFAFQPLVPFAFLPQFAFQPLVPSAFLLQFAFQSQEEKNNQYVKSYINSCFKQPKDIEQIVKNEKELLKAIFQEAQKKWKELEAKESFFEGNYGPLVAFCLSHFLVHTSIRFQHIQDFEIKWEESQCVIRYSKDSIPIKDRKLIEEKSFIATLRVYYNAFLNLEKNPSFTIQKKNINEFIEKDSHQKDKLNSLIGILASLVSISSWLYSGSKGWDYFLFASLEVALGVLADGSKSLYTFSWSSAVTTLFSTVLDFIIQNKKGLFEQQKKWLMHQYFTYSYDLPLALKRDFHQFYSNDKKDTNHSNNKKDVSCPIKVKPTLFGLDFSTTFHSNNKKDVFYPIKVKPTLFCLDFSTTFFGGKMNSFSYESQLGWFYKNKTSGASSPVLRILKYIIVDELRNGKLNLNNHISDKDFFQRDLSSIDVKNYKFNKKYKKHRVRMTQYKKLAQETGIDPIKSYNTALDFFINYKNEKATDKGALSIDFLQALDAIGENNIKALYVGTSDRSKDLDRPLFIGRLATTIIIEDGLWIG